MLEFKDFMDNIEPIRSIIIFDIILITNYIYINLRIYLKIKHLRRELYRKNSKIFN